MHTNIITTLQHREETSKLVDPEELVTELLKLRHSEAIKLQAKEKRTEAEETLWRDLRESHSLCGRTAVNYLRKDYMPDIYLTTKRRKLYANYKLEKHGANTEVPTKQYQICTGLQYDKK